MPLAFTISWCSILKNRVNSVIMLFSFFLFLTNNVNNIPRKELDEQKATFAAIKNRIFAPYFESEFSKDFYQEKVMQLKTGWSLLGQLVSPMLPKTTLSLYLSLCLSQQTITKDKHGRINTEIISSCKGNPSWRWYMFTEYKLYKIAYINSGEMLIQSTAQPQVFFFLLNSQTPLLAYWKGNK